ncbi:MAG: copper ion binding protein [Acidimicrobiia bacterium]|nr:copper ion binding protein [Acidimicrobiia bacterium]MDX2468702.1 copper ion binding protein [Acidimicrobiia bacterium]
MTETTLSVPEIHCDHCKMSIEGAVKALEGVASAEVSVEKATVSVGFDAPASIEGIIGAIVDQGYDVPSK